MSCLFFIWFAEVSPWSSLCNKIFGTMEPDMVHFFYGKLFKLFFLLQSAVSFEINETCSRLNSSLMFQINWNCVNICSCGKGSSVCACYMRLFQMLVHNYYQSWQIMKINRSELRALYWRINKMVGLKFLSRISVLYGLRKEVGMYKSTFCKL